MKNIGLKYQFGIKDILMVLGMGCFVYFNSHYFLFSFQIVIGLVIFPLLLIKNAQQTGNYKFAFFSLAFLILASVFQLQVFLFAAWACFIIYLLEFYYGNVGYLPLFFVGAISPALYYVVAIFSFPLRLELSEISCYLFQKIGYAIENKGSYFVLPNGASFQVDQACIGLKMIGTGLISGILILAFQERKNQKQYSFFAIGSLMLLLSALLVISNLLRILALVLVQSLPGSLSHELIGLASLFIYAVMPFYLLTHFWFKPKRNLINAFWAEPNKFIKLVPTIGLLALSIFSYFFLLVRTETKRDLPLEKLELNGMQKTPREDGVMEFKNDSVLMYIKPAIKAFEGGHPPQICWQASGFELCNFKEQKLGDFSFMLGSLKKGENVQYTAWWYDNGEIKTIHEWEWRRRNAAPFRVINIITLDSLHLQSQVDYYLRNSLFP